MMLTQKTIAAKQTLSGIGVHTGSKSTMTLCPAEPGTGIQFVRVDLPGKPAITASVENVAETARGTILANGAAKVHTVEHIMAALWAYGITNLVIEVDAEEPPVGDGSSLVFVDLLQQAGTRIQAEPASLYEIHDAVSVTEGDASVAVVPYNGFRISYTLDYGHPLVDTQFVSLDLDQESFVREIAPCRTFCFYREIEALMEGGLIQGGSLDNAVVIGDEAILSKEGLRFQDEFARHKILDLIGDLYLLGIRLQGHLIAMKSGHALNIRFANLLRDHYGVPQDQRPGGRSVSSMSLEDIMEVLPHRYPFLLVDRITHIEETGAEGIKNVTANEYYFKGHFPEQPLMPGVLQIEAMAQVAGASLMRLHNLDGKGKRPVLVGVDRVKFKKPVIPGDQLQILVSWSKVKKNVGRAVGAVKVDGQLVSEARITFALVEE